MNLYCDNPLTNNIINSITPMQEKQLDKNMQYEINIATPNPANDIALEKSRNYITYLKNQRDIQCFVCEYNKKGLSSVYNEVIKFNTSERIIFMHDDLEIHDIFFLDKLDEAHEKFDIVGLAGGKFTKKPDIAMWHLMGEPSDFSGSISHTNGTKTWTNVYGEQGKDVDLLDGVFISIKREVYNKHGLKFDEDFAFHHYDLSFCCIAKKLGIRMGTPPQPIYAVHHGLGMPDSSWQGSNNRFKEKYY